MTFMFHSFLEHPWQDQNISQTTSSPSMATEASSAKAERHLGHQSFAFGASDLERLRVQKKEGPPRKAGEAGPRLASHVEATTAGLALALPVAASPAFRDSEQSLERIYSCPGGLLAEQRCRGYCPVLLSELDDLLYSHLPNAGRKFG